LVEKLLPGENFPVIGENEANAYSSSKLFADQYLSNLKDFEKITIVRPFLFLEKGRNSQHFFQV